MRESEIEQYFDWAVQMAGGKTWKVKCIGQRGFPDRFARLPDGSLWVVELKAPHGRLSALQREFAEAMKGSNYSVLWNKEQVDDFLRQRV